MDFMTKMKSLAKADVKTIILPEGEESRNLTAVAQITQEGIAKIVLLGDEETIKANAAALSIDISKCRIINPSVGEKFEEYANTFYELRKKKGVTPEQAKEILKDPMYYGTMMVKMDDADGMVSGATHTTGDLLLPGFQIIKTAPGVSVVSSFFIMLTNSTYGENGTLLFADCAVNPMPDEDQLASIAISTADTAKNLLKIEPKVAMLSFSTKGSAQHEVVTKVQNAVKIANERRPDLNIDGELQADAALVASVAKLKAPDSKVAGSANVLIFPDLQSGNIGYKLVQRIAGAEAIGPICQGFAKPINDLSRGCNAEDIVNVVAVTAVQAQTIQK